MRPSICRMVVYTAPAGARGLAAVITRVDEQLALPTHPHLADDENSFQVWLAVFAHTATIRGLEFSDAPVPFSPDPKPGHWSWPPRV
jgi:hypothetical protein